MNFQVIEILRSFCFIPTVEWWKGNCLQRSFFAICQEKLFSFSASHPLIPPLLDNQRKVLLVILYHNSLSLDSWGMSRSSQQRTLCRGFLNTGLQSSGLSLCWVSLLAGVQSTWPTQSSSPTWAPAFGQRTFLVLAACRAVTTGLAATVSTTCFCCWEPRYHPGLGITPEGWTGREWEQPNGMCHWETLLNRRMTGGRKGEETWWEAERTSSQAIGHGRKSSGYLKSWIGLLTWNNGNVPCEVRLNSVL